MGQQIIRLLTGAELTCAVLQVQMGLEKQEAKHHMKACWTNREVYETFPDQSGIFPEHSINASTHITSSSALTFLILALLNNAAINYEITSLICLHASNCTTVKFCNLKTLLKIWVPYPLVPRVPSWHAGHLKATSDFYMTYNKDPKTFLREILRAFWCCNKKKTKSKGCWIKSENQVSKAWSDTRVTNCTRSPETKRFLRMGVQLVLKPRKFQPNQD